jgi:putative membrane protein
MLSPWRFVINAIRGMLIGLAEIVPGVSGGTVALIVGVYRDVIHAASSVVASAVSLVKTRRLAPSKALLGEARGVVVVPVLVGMIAGIFLGAALLEPLITANPVETRAVFAGLILASLIVPIRMVGSQWNVTLVGVALIAAGATFLLTGLPALAGGGDPLVFVAPAAALAVCALVLPGVSGSFLLVTLGMYEPTLAAVNQRDFAYLGVFVAGAIVGIAAFVRVLQWMLTQHRVVTLVVMTGLMAGSLRALWPWQGSSRELLAPAPDSAGIWLLMLAGVGVVATLVLVEKFSQPRVNL